MRVIDKSGREKISGFPIGAVIPMTGTSIPTGWSLCDGTGGTINMQDRFIIGASTVGLGVTSGSTSPVTGLVHSGMAVGAHSNHVVTQAGAHTDHGVTEMSAHSAHGVTQASAHGTHATDGAHTHDAHTTKASTTGIGTEITNPVTHASQGGHTHDAHSAHSGFAVDAHSAHSGTAVDAHTAHSGADLNAHSAHSVTQQSNHSILKNYLLAYIQRIS